MSACVSPALAPVAASGARVPARASAARGFAARAARKGKVAGSATLGPVRRTAAPRAAKPSARRGARVVTAAAADDEEKVRARTIPRPRGRAPKRASATGSLSPGCDANVSARAIERSDPSAATDPRASRLPPPLEPKPRRFPSGTPARTSC